MRAVAWRSAGLQTCRALLSILPEVALEGRDADVTCVQSTYIPRDTKESSPGTLTIHEMYFDIYIKLCCHTAKYLGG